MSDDQQQTEFCLLKLQIGPVQDFIAQARSTRDLWSGSYLLSWLMAAGLHVLDESKAHIIYPAWTTQPLRQLRQQTKTVSDFKMAAIPNLPNVLVAKVSRSEATALVLAVEKAIYNEWEAIAQAVEDFCQRKGISISNHERFHAQVQKFLSIAWQVTPWHPDFAGNWGKWTHTNAGQLAAVRQTHAFEAWNSGGWHAAKTNNKDSLNGRDEAVAGGREWCETLSDDFKPFFKNHDWMGAITVIKRLWHCAYIVPKWDFKQEHFQMPNTLGVAAHDPFGNLQPKLHDEDTAPAAEDLAESGRYFAVLAFDGDQMGKYLHELRSAKAHNEFSNRLATFALTKVSALIESFKGRVIYAGGDDVLAMLPADTVLQCAEDLRNGFKQMTGCDASAGIAIAHYKNPLQDVVRAAQVAEKRAKRKLGRSAVSITLLKRSGESIEWGCQWNEGLDLFKAISTALIEERLSAKFTYAVVELLQAYLTARTTLMVKDASAKPVAGFEVAEVIQREFAHVLGRQHGPQFPKEPEAQQHFCDQLTSGLKKYLFALQRQSPSPDDQLQHVIGLCQTIAFSPSQSRAENGEPKHTA